MARLASISKAGFYPIPPELLPAVGAAVTLDWGAPDGARSYQQTRHAVLDPCAGEGDAVFPLATMWRGTNNDDFQVFACELESTRFGSLTARCRGFSTYKGHIAKGDAFSLNITTSVENPGVSILYLNPPYDTDKEHGRLEERWLVRFTSALRAGGVLIFVVPYYALKASAATLAKSYEDIQVCQFPAEHFAAFKQVILFARRRQTDLLFADPAVEAAVLVNAESLESLTPLANVRPYTIDAVKSSGIFAGSFATQAVDPIEMRAAFKPWHGMVKRVLLPISKVLPSVPWLDLSLRTFPVACPPRASYIAAGIASGVFNGCRIEPDDASSGLPPLYLKGTFKREFHDTEVVKNDKGEVTKQVQVQHPELTITVLNATTCAEYITLASSVEVNPGETDVAKFTVGDLFSRYGASLMRVLKQRCPILHDPSNPAHAMVLPTFPRKLFRAQEHAVRTAVKLIKGPDRAALILGQIGSGKSTVATATAQAVGAQCVLIMCPPHLITSWTDQCKYVIPWARVYPLEKPADLYALAMDREPGMKVALLSRETAKLGHALESVYHAEYSALLAEEKLLSDDDFEAYGELQKRKAAVWQCPECRRPINPAWTPDFITSKRKTCEAIHLKFVNTEAKLVRRLAWELAARFPGSDVIGQLLDAPALNKARKAQGKHESLTARVSAPAVAAILGELMAAMESKAHRVAVAHPYASMANASPQAWAVYHLCAFLAGHGHEDLVYQTAARVALWEVMYGKRKDGSEYKPEDADYDKAPSGSANTAALVWRLVSLLPAAMIDRFLAWADGGASAIEKPVEISYSEWCAQWGAGTYDGWYEAKTTAADAYKEQVDALKMYDPPQTEPKQALDILAGRPPASTAHMYRSPLASLAILDLEAEDKLRAERCGGSNLTHAFQGRALGDPLHVMDALSKLKAGATIKTDEKCGARLYQAVPRPRRYPLAKLIVRRYKHLFDFLILDEGHEYANEASAQSQAAQRLFGLKLPTVLLTGSIMNGYASSLFMPCWSLSRRFRDEFGRRGVDEYVNKYGYLKRTITFSGNKAEVSYGKVSDAKEKQSVAQAPGVMPVSLLRHVLPIAVTLQLEDLEAELPETQEIVIPVEPPPEVRHRYAQARDKLLAAIKRDRFTKKAGKLFGQLSELPSYLDRATSDTGNRLNGHYVVQYPKDVGGEVLADFEGCDPLVMLPKERKMCEIITGELQEGRRVMVFPWHTELMPRLKKLIEAQCKCRVVILEADKVGSKKREHWIDKNVVKPGIEVLIVNPVAVQTGLNNLVHFCSVIWYENPGCNPQVRRQAQGRIYRIGQTKPVRNYTLYYENTAQSLLHELLLYKVGISEAVDGLDPKGSLQAAGVGEVSELSGQSVGAVLYKMLVKEMG